MKNLGIFSLLLLLFLSSCRKDERIIDTVKTTPDPTFESYVPPVNNITGDVIGFVVDENNTPVVDAMVTLENNTFTTDAYGHFFIENETMNSLGTLVEVQKDGYFEGSRRFFPTEGKQSRVKIQLLEKSFNQSFNATNGGTIAISNGASVEFSANSIKTADGSIYSGTVKVASKWMDPSLSATLDQMPGNLQGINSQVEQMALTTYGMIAVELEGDAGESLNIADGKTATITMPVPASMLSAAPSEIPLWSYHKELGLWIEESTATLQGDKYVGNVTHFSFWNVDIPMAYTNLEMTLVYDNGNPLNNYLVTLTMTSTTNEFSSGSGYTNQDGYVSGIIPANEVLVMVLLDVCGDVLFTQNIGPFATDTDLGNVTISGTNVNSTTITGNLLDCGAPLVNGLVIAKFDGQSVYHYTNTSSFTMTFSSCMNTSDIQVKGINVDNFEHSTPTTVPANVSTDLGNIDICGIQGSNYISITIDGVTGFFENAMALATTGIPATTSMESSSQDHFINIYFDGTTTGNYTSSAFIEVVSSTVLGWGYDSFTFSSLVVTQYDTVLVGTFEGVVHTSISTTLPMTGSFNINL